MPFTLPPPALYLGSHLGTATTWHLLSHAKHTSTLSILDLVFHGMHLCTKGAPAGCARQPYTKPSIPHLNMQKRNVKKTKHEQPHPLTFVMAHNGSFFQKIYTLQSLSGPACWFTCNSNTRTTLAHLSFCAKHDPKMGFWSGGGGNGVLEQIFLQVVLPKNLSI